MALYITFVQLLPYIVLILAVIGIVIFYVFYEKNRNQKPTDDTYLKTLIEALGDISNIKSVNHVQRRTQIELISPEKVNIEQLKNMQVSAFITGKKITLLLNEKSDHTLHQLIKNRKEEQ